MLSFESIGLLVSCLFLSSVTGASVPSREMSWPIHTVILLYFNNERNNTWLCDELYLGLTVEGTRHDLYFQKSSVCIFCSS